MHAWGKNPKMLVFTRVYVCVKAKLTLLSFFCTFPLANLWIKFYIFGHVYGCHVHDEVRWGGQKEGHEGRAWPGIWDNPKNVKKTSSRLAVGGPDPKKSYYSKHCNLGSFVEIIHSDFEPGQGRCCCQSACWHLSKGPAPALQCKTPKGPGMIWLWGKFTLSNLLSFVLLLSF